MAFLIQPTREELNFLLKLYPGRFNQEGLDAFYLEIRHEDPRKRFYRFEFCDGCMDNTAETYWQYNPERNQYMIGVLVRKDMRREGYGHEAVRLMKLAAREYDIHAFYVEEAEFDESVIAFLQHEGFEKQDGFWELKF